MSKVYLVSSGEYSDYSIDGIFSSKEKAMAFMYHFHKEDGYGGYNDVAEREVDPWGEQIDQGLTLWRVYIRKQGDTDRCSMIDPSSNEVGYEFYGNALCFQVWAKNQDHAIKIAGERRARIIADGGWPEGKEV